MLAANEAVASHLEAAGIPMIFAFMSVPTPSASWSLKKSPVQFGYSLSPGAVPVKRFRETRRSHWIIRTDFEELSEAGREDRRKARGEDPQLSDAPFAEAGAL